LPAIERLRERRPELVIGAGTVWSGSDYALACERGAQFLVSPGTTDELFAHAASGDLRVQGVRARSVVYRVSTGISSAGWPRTRMTRRFIVHP
jgi:2-keto-3-deoxy-6-phosphogluconate aldolase